MQVIYQFLADSTPCAYLPDRVARHQYVIASEICANEYEDLLNRGYRKFGNMLFQTRCQQCRECRPVRIPVESFQPDRSQRRALKINQDLAVRIAAPLADETRLELYNRYHQWREQEKGWPSGGSSLEEYTLSFVLNPLPGAEITIWEGATLRAVMLADLTPNVISAVYHYHDPDCQRRSLGTFSILQTIELARRLKRRWVYLGFYVAGCESMSYKLRFKPCEMMSAEGEWQTVQSCSASIPTATSQSRPVDE